MAKTSGERNPVTGRNPKVDAYMAKAAAFAQPILEYLREVIHEGAPGVIEEMKWSRPFFVLDGVIIGNISAFKAHCSFGLWDSELASKLRQEGVTATDGMGTFGKLTSIKDLPPRSKLVGYVRLAANSIQTGVRTVSYKRPRVAKPEAEVPAMLLAALKKNKAASAKFATMTPGCRREYCAWITEAKREETQAKRATQAVEWIAEGKSRNWKYEQPA